MDKDQRTGSGREKSKGDGEAIEGGELGETEGGKMEGGGGEGWTEDRRAGRGRGGLGVLGNGRISGELKELKFEHVDLRAV